MFSPPWFRTGREPQLRRARTNQLRRLLWSELQRSALDFAHNHKTQHHSKLQPAGLLRPLDPQRIFVLAGRLGCGGLPQGRPPLTSRPRGLAVRTPATRAGERSPPIFPIQRYEQGARTPPEVMFLAHARHWALMGRARASVCFPPMVQDSYLNHS